MKQLLLSLLIMPVIVFAQSTTEKEYNYMTKGFQEVDEKGAGLLQGYSIEKLPSDSKSFDFILFKRNDGSHAGIIIKVTTTGSGSTVHQYYAIPAGGANSFGWDQFNGDVSSSDIWKSRYILNWVSHRLMYEMDQRRQDALKNK